MASPTRGGTTETGFRAISGREITLVRTRVNAESTEPASTLQLNAIATPLYQLKW